MLSSMMSTVSSTMSAASSTTSAVTMMTTIGLSELSVMAVVTLIILLSASEILSASKLWNSRLALTLNMAIVPLCLAFFAIVAFKVMEII